MKKYNLPKEPIDGIWKIGPFLGNDVKFWYGEIKVDGKYSPDLNYLNIYLVKYGEGKIKMPGKLYELLLHQNSYAILNDEHELYGSLSLHIVRVPRHRLNDYSFLYGEVLSSKYPIGEWVGSPLSLGFYNKVKIIPEKQKPHLHKKSQEGWLTKSGDGILRIVNEYEDLGEGKIHVISDEYIDLMPNSLVISEPFEPHAILEIEKPLDLVVFNYPSTKDDNYEVIW